MRPHQRQQSPKRADRSAVLAIRTSNREDYRPLAEQLCLGLEQRAIRIVNIGRFGGHAVQLDDRQVIAAPERVDVGITDIEPSDEEAWVCTSDRVDPLLQRRREQMSSVAEQ